MRQWVWFAGVFAGVGVVAGWACAGGTPAFESGPDAGGRDALTGVDPPLVDVAATFNDMTNQSFWQTFNLPTHLDAGATATGYAYPAFDGRYLYLPPAEYSSQHPMLRFDTHGSLTDTEAWKTFDYQTALPGSPSGIGGTFADANYVYFAPYKKLDQTLSSVFLRYDRSQAFDTPGAWTSFDATTVDGGADLAGYVGAIFDGVRYGYFGTYRKNSGYSGLFTRFDTQATFTNTGSWKVHDTESFPPTTGVRGMEGAVYDGRYAYLVPYSQDGTNGDGVVARYDTTLDIDATEAWKKFDVAAFYPKASGFAGGVSDGRYIYFVPNISLIDGVIASGSVVARYDTQGAAFDDGAAWKAFDAAQLHAEAKGFNGGVFDGRYIYLVPADSAALIVRYDTTLPFADARSWQRFSLTTLDADAHTYATAAFDGRYVYLVPYGTGVIARFDARTPPAAKPYTHSFY